MVGLDGQESTQQRDLQAFWHHCSLGVWCPMVAMEVWDRFSGLTSEF